jgi:transcriptional regulator with XRE-family HTH domain
LTTKQYGSMVPFEKLLRSEAYWETKIQNDLYAAVEQYMKENGLSRKEFAQMLGVSKGYVSQILNGDFNHRLSKLIELALAIGKTPLMEFKDLDNYIKSAFKENSNNTTYYFPGNANLNYRTLEYSKEFKRYEVQEISDTVYISNISNPSPA